MEVIGLASLQLDNVDNHVVADAWGDDLWMGLLASLHVDISDNQGVADTTSDISSDTTSDDHIGLAGLPWDGDQTGLAALPVVDCHGEIPSCAQFEDRAAAV